MQVRNQKWVDAAHTVIDCEIEHPVYGWIPFTASQNDPETHGQEIYAALALGVVAEYEPPLIPPPPPPTTPSEVTMRQARLALLAAGKLGDVAAALASIADPVQRQAAQIEWEYSSSVKRDSGLVTQLASALSLTDVQIDALFMAAANQ